MRYCASVCFLACFFSGLKYFHRRKQTTTTTTTTTREKKKIHRCKHLSFYIDIYLLWVTNYMFLEPSYLHVSKPFDLWSKVSLRPATHCAILTVWHMFGYDIKFTVRTMKTQTESRSATYVNQRQCSRVKCHRRMSSIYAATLKQETERKEVEQLRSWTSTPQTSASHIFFFTRFASMARCKPSVSLGPALASRWSVHTAFLLDGWLT